MPSLPGDLVGVDSREPLPLQVPVAPGLIIVVLLLRLVGSVAVFLPLGSSVTVSVAPPSPPPPPPPPRSSEFLWEMAVWVLVAKEAVVNPTSIPLRDALVRRVAV